MDEIVDKFLFSLFDLKPKTLPFFKIEMFLIACPPCPQFIHNEINKNDFFPLCQKQGKMLVIFRFFRYNMNIETNTKKVVHISTTYIIITIYLFIYNLIIKREKATSYEICL